MAEPITNVLGIVGMDNKGEYNENTYYEKLNVVSYNGSSYCAKDSVHNILPTDTTKWQLIASKGDTGDTGATGQNGYTPIKGTDYYTAEDKAELESTLESDVTDEVSSQLSTLTSATPLVASSTAGMTDTSRIYVNTSDGHWYWHNGSTWNDGGTYQSTGIGAGEVGVINLDNTLKETIGIYKPSYTITDGYYIRYDAEIIEQTGYCYTSPIQLKANQKIKLKSRGANQNVSIITKCNQDGTNLVPLVISVDSTLQEYTYETTENIYIILCGRTGTIQEDYIYDLEDKVTLSQLNEKSEYNLNYAFNMTNNSPIIYGGTTFTDYSKTMEQGYFSDGTPSSSTTRIRSIDYVTINQKTKLINLLNNSSYRIFIFNTDNTYVGTTDWITTKSYEYDFTNTKKYKFAFKFNDNSDIIPSDLYDKFFILSGQNDLANSLKETLDIDTNEYPSYWDSTINEISEDINDLKKSYTAANNEIATFFLIGDPHYPSHNYVTSKLIKYLSKKCGINLSICLGDLIEDSTEGHEQNLSRIQDAMNQLQYGIDRMLLTQGNHDNGAGIVDGNGQIKFARVVPDNEWIHHTSSKLLVTPKIEFDELGKAFYYDDEINKIRFISLDSFENKSYTVDSNDVITSSDLGSCTNRQINWLVNNALNNIPSGYGIITFSHKPLYHPVINDQEIERTELTINGSAVITAINNFKNNGGNYIAHLSGHQHHDFLDNLNNIPQVVNLNDGKHWRQKSYWGSQADLVGDSPLKISGTTNECAFDVVIINKTTRHIDLIRVGAGVSRQINY